MNTDLIYAVRKHGQITVDTRNQAQALVAAARQHGYTFRQRQTFGGFLVIDYDD